MYGFDVTWGLRGESTRGLVSHLKETSCAMSRIFETQTKAL